MKTTTLLCCCVWLSLILPLASMAQDARFSGQQSTWHGYARFDFEVAGKEVTVIEPRQAAAGKPWVWYGEFFGNQPVPDLALLGRGFHIVYMKIPNQFGSPEAVELWNTLHQELTRKHGLAQRAALIGISRGGLYCYNWAAANPDKVACIYGDAPVCDLGSWPAHRGKGSGNDVELKRIKEVYNVTTDDELLAKALNPIDHLQPLANAKIPLLHVYGDADMGVPWDENTGVLAERYRAFGGKITLIAKPGVGHVHGLDDSTPIIDFIERHSLAAISSDKRTLDIGSRRELFVDRYLIDRMSNAYLHLHEPRDEGTVLRFDAPHEGPYAGYTTIIRDGELFKMYYRGISKLGLDGSADERSCYAESRDGINWTKPQLGLFDFDGSSQNNIVLADAAPVTHNFCPMLDSNPIAPASERYKAVGGTLDKLYAFTSPDGLRWTRLRSEPILSKANVPFPHLHLFDSQNVVFWSESESKYVCYFRVWDGLRKIARSTSPDFKNWSPAVLMQQLHDDGIARPQLAPAEHLYTNQTSPYFRAPHIYIAAAARFFEGRRVLTTEQANAIQVNPDFFNDTSDAILMTSRGGTIYDRTFLEGFIKPGIGARNWVSRTNYPALNIVPTGPTEMSLYVNHDYAQPSAHVRRYSLRLDGFASVRAGVQSGELITKPLIVSGDSLSINFATSAGGGIRVELQDAQGTPLQGFELDECQEQIGNEIERRVSWKSNPKLVLPKGKPVRVRFVLKDADLYSMQFQQNP